VAPYNPPPDAYGVANNCEPATVEYFIEVFGYNEALELSRLEDPTANTINYQRIQVALNDAALLVNNFAETAPPQGKLLIAGSYRRTQATLARYYLDTLRPRQQVVDAANAALKQLDLWASKASPSSGLKWQEAYRYWNSACAMTMSNTQRDRAFTDASLARWEMRWGTNNRWNPFKRKAAPVIDHVTPRQPSGSLDRQNVTLIGNSTLEVNKLFDDLETTRDVASFADSQDAVIPDEGDVLVVENTDGDITTTGGLQEADTF
jgi:phage gp36-like protein